MGLSFAVLFISGMWCKEQKNAVSSRKFWMGQCQLEKEEELVEDIV